MSEDQDAVAAMDPAEFRDGGYLSEVNRRFLHPLGLSLAVNFDATGTATGYVVVDDRADPEGWYMGDDIMPEVTAKAAKIQKEWNERYEARYVALGYMIQPTDDSPSPV